MIILAEGGKVTNVIIYMYIILYTSIYMSEAYGNEPMGCKKCHVRNFQKLIGSIAKCYNVSRSKA